MRHVSPEHCDECRAGTTPGDGADSADDARGGEAPRHPRHTDHHDLQRMADDGCPHHGDHA